MSVGALTSQNILQLYSNTILISNGVNSTSTDTGALIVGGGVGVSGNLSVGGILNLDGGLSVAGDFDISGKVSVSDSTDSTSSSTGCLILEGGMGVAKNAHFGSNLYVAGNLTTTSISYETSEVIVSTADSTSVTSGASVIMGGCGIVKNLNVGGVIGSINTSASTSISTGAVIVAGGIGIGGAIYAGNGIYGDFRGSLITSTDNSTSTSTGCIVISGGVGIAKNLNIGGNADVSTITVESGTSSTNYLTGACVINGGIGIGNNLNVLGNIDSGGISSLKTVNVTSTLSSTSTDTGALVVSGGVGVGDGLNVNGVVHCYNTTDSNSRTTGSLILDGGLGVYGSIHSGVVHSIITTDSTSTSTGAIIVGGGLGVSKKSNFGDTVTFRNVTDSTKTTTFTVDTNGDLTADCSGNDWYWANTDVVHITSNQGAFTDSSVGSLVVLGGATYNRSVHITGISNSLRCWYYGSDSCAMRCLGSGLELDNFTGSYSNMSRISAYSSYGASPITHTVRIGNGLISDYPATLDTYYTDLKVGGDGTFSIYSSGEKTTITNTADSTSIGTGSLVVNSGVSIAKKLHLGDTFTIHNSDRTKNCTFTVDANGDMLSNCSGNDWYFDQTDIVHISSTATSTSTSTGALIISGGVGIGGTLSIDHLTQTGTYYEDVNVYANVRTVGASAPSFTEYFTGAGRGVYGYELPYNSEKIIYFTFQYPHGGYTGTGANIYPHLHVFGNITATGKSSKLGIGYYIRDIDEVTAFVSPTTYDKEYTNTSFTFDKHIVIPLHDGNGIDVSTKSASFIMWGYVKRYDDNALYGANAYTGSYWVVGLDVHCKISKMGDTIASP